MYVVDKKGEDPTQKDYQKQFFIKNEHARHLKFNKAPCTGYTGCVGKMGQFSCKKFSGKYFNFLKLLHENCNHLKKHPVSKKHK